MGRKAEPGILFYSMNCNHITNRKIKLLHKDRDSDGYWIWQCLLSYGYENKGYYFDTNDKDEVLLFADDYCKKDVSLVWAVIESCINRELFDKNISDQFGILTSDHMQEMYVHATAERRRKGTSIEIVKEYLLIDIPEDTRNISIVPRENSIIPRNKEIVPRNNSDEVIKTVPPTAEEIKLKELKKDWDDITKEKRLIYEFIKNKKPGFIDPYIAMYNIWAAERSKPKVTAITDKRKSHLSARLKEKEFNFLDILAKAATAPLILNGSWFNFDWFTKSKDNYIKVLEGNYDKESMPVQQPQQTSKSKNADDKFLQQFEHENK